MHSITVQDNCDVLICGSTLYALDVALAAASNGQHVVVAMERTNPLIELISSLRSYVDNSDDVSKSALLTGILNETPVSASSSRFYINPHQVAKWVEDQLIEAGITFYYNATPVSALKNEERLCGAVFGGKPGLFAITAKSIFDCTLSSVIAKTSGAPLVESNGPVKACYSMELSGEPEPGEHRVSHGGVSGTLHVHRFFAEFDLEIADSDMDPLGYARDFVRIYDAALAALDANNLSRFRGADVYFHSGHQSVESENGKVAGIESLYICGPLSVEGNDLGQLILRDPLALHRSFPDYLTAEAHHEQKSEPASVIYTISAAPGSGSFSGYGNISFSDPSYDAPGTARATVQVEGSIFVHEDDLVIAGCGTSGVGAAYHAGRLGLSPLVLDNALEVGGTTTVGGVTNLWFGRNTKAFKDLYKESGATNDGLNASPFFSALRCVGVRLLPFTPICGTGWSGKEVERVYIITPEGLASIEARQFIDATGDGSVAAWSGAEYSYGSERDGIPSWGSFGSFIKGRPEAIRQFLSTVDERSAADATRFIIAMRRCRKDVLDKADYVHPAFYIAPRTTRHIKGATTVTYLDMLAGRKFKDGILRAGSNIDTKGTETSNAFKVGFYPFERLKRFEITIPYSSLIPLGFHNLIVVGKAYSITNDALTMARMQRDLFVLGMVAAESVRLSREEETTLPEISVPALQGRLMMMGALSESDVAADDFGFPASAEDLVDKLLACNDYQDSLEVSAQLTVLGKEAVLPIFKQRDLSMTPSLARLFCFWKVDEGVDYIRTQLEGALSGSGADLPMEVYASDYKAHDLPDHGFAPLPVLYLNNLALAGDQKVPSLLSEMVERFDQILNSPSHIWAYTFGFAYASERLAGEDVEVCLAQLIDHPVFEHRLLSRGSDLRDCANIRRERLAYLRLCLARALARCGSRKGVAYLIDYLSELRASFAANARRELVDVTGVDFGYDQEAWSDWLSNLSKELNSVPVMVDYL